MTESGTSTFATGPDVTHATMGDPPSRRGLLACAVGLVAGAVAPGSPPAPAAMPDIAGRDAELIRLCDALVECGREEEARNEIYSVIVDEPPEHVLAAAQRLADQMGEIAEAIVWLPAAGMAGLRAKASAMAIYIGEFPAGKPESDDLGERLAWSLGRDVRGVV